MALAEAEVKYELTEDEYRRMPDLLRELGFSHWKDEELIDYYLHYAVSPHRGYDYTRVREVNGELTLTRKAWEPDAQGHFVRLEEERALSREEFVRMQTAAGQVPVLRKRRSSYCGAIHGEPATIVLDTLYRNDVISHYLECEMLVPPEQAHDARVRLTAWLRTSLPIASEQEAPSMLELLLGE